MHFVLAQKSCRNGEHNPSSSIPAAVGSKDGLCAPPPGHPITMTPGPGSEKRETRKSKGNISFDPLAENIPPKPRVFKCHIHTIWEMKFK